MKNSLKAKSRCVCTNTEWMKRIRLVCTEERTSEWVQFGAHISRVFFVWPFVRQNIIYRYLYLRNSTVRIAFITLKRYRFSFSVPLSIRAKSLVPFVPHGFPHKCGNAISSSGQSDITMRVDICIRPCIPCLNTSYDVNIYQN